MEIKNESHNKLVQQITHRFHRKHPLVLVAEQSNEALKTYSDGCGELLSAPYFFCIHCNYHLHKQCAEAPLSLPNHPLHPQHSDVGFFLRQRPRSFDWMLYIFVLTVHHSSFTRNALMSYLLKLITLHIAYTLLFLTAVIVMACATYAKSNIPDLFMVVLFANLKSMLNVLGRGPLLKIKAAINTHSPCFGDKPGCNYVVHVNCVLEDDELYKVIEEEKQCEELYEKSMQSSIIRVIEMNEAREATKIQHFSHQHCLNAPFFLHKTCAELPRIKQHWFRQGNAILLFKGFLECNFCDQRFSGFFYHIGGWEMCLRCAKVADIIECEGHQHFLFIDFKYREKCNGCGKRCCNGAFRGGKCRFALDFGCLTLPHSTLHKIDEHKLKLTYDDDKEQIYCDICE
ncbi:hypothetical protein CXB51_016008 [Gossypium anomalum]|uniref:DC1 domain-containing protein n=1 Tax=Gossypium anomalum TaxID=47600 RepID=A0A8J6D0D0_9ROSI|nr:hypothetical protein CXB51_016008 [Gossypium anomalum]